MRWVFVVLIVLNVAAAVANGYSGRRRLLAVNAFAAGLLVGVLMAGGAA